MIDLQDLRQDPDKYRRALARKGADTDIDHLLGLDAQRRQCTTEVEELRATRNRVSKEIGQLKKQGQDASGASAEMRKVGDEIKTIEARLREVSDALDMALLAVPNLPADNAPEGLDETANRLVRTCGQAREFDFEPKPHWEVGQDLDVLDLARGTKIAGTGFPLYKGDGARMERALWNFMLDLHTREHGYTEVFAPFLANRSAMTGTGQLPKLESDMYRLEADDLFLIPTAEVPLTNLHREEVLPAGSLPIYVTGYTACFRREAGAAGKDTRGILRVHQFNKVEMVKFVHPDTSYQELEALVANAETVLQRLGLHYRVSELCCGDMSFAAAKCYDLEAWAPGCEQWLEVSSCSNFVDFQARRAGIRFKDDKGKTRFVHTLNGSGLATPRTLIAILENYQQADGSVTIPDVLRPYMGGQEKIERRP